jgi:Ubiquitin-like autophagy protein Apg12.
MSVNYHGFLFSVDILLKATGNAPIMKKKKWAVDPDRKIGWIMEFMKKYLKLDRSEQLVIFNIRKQTSTGMRNRPLRTQLYCAC